MLCECSVARTYPAHHELESVIAMIVIVVIIIIIPVYHVM